MNNKQNTQNIRQFLITSDHYVKGTNTYRYVLPIGMTVNTGDQIAVQCASIYNNSFNIRKDWNNNTFVIFYNGFNLNNIPSSFVKGNVYTDPYDSSIVVNKKYVQITIPDGYYDVPALNAFLLQQCHLLGFYLKGANNSGDMYFMNFLVNPNVYKMEIDMFVIPNSLPTGYSLPSNTFSLPSPAQTPFLYFPAAPPSKYGSFASIFGFPNSTFFPNSAITNTNGASVSSQTLSATGYVPCLNPITTYIFTCNLVSNQYCNPDNLFFQMPINAAYGDLMVYNSYPIFITARSSSYQYIEISIYDQFLNNLVLNDSEFNITILWSQNII
jgi:hypothetical protein